MIAAVTGPAARGDAGAPAPLPAQGADRHLGVATCSSTVCHGAVSPTRAYDVQMNEYVTWSHHDAHARAYATLNSPRSREIAARLGLANAAAARLCLDCHADNIPESRRGEKFTLADGIGCEACHGGAERWLSSHASKRTSWQDDLARGMYPTAELGARSRLCLSCHYGGADKFASHRIMAAGHPRLSFELDTFLALEPPHYEVDEDYRRRKPTYSHTQTWAYGQLAAADAELKLLQGPRLADAKTFPELALFNCYGCHMSSMHRNDWGHRLLELESEPGSVPINDGHLALAWLITRQLAPAEAPELLRRSQALIAASGAGRERIIECSAQLASLLTPVRELAARRAWSDAQRGQLLDALIALGVGGEFRDYIGAEQAVMGIDGLLIDLRLARAHKADLDEIYALVQKDEAFDPERFAAALRRLQEQLQASR